MRATCKALQCNEVLAPDNAKSHAHEWNVQCAGEDFGVQSAKSAQQIDLIAVIVSQYEHRGYGVIRISATQFGAETGAPEHCLQGGHLAG